MKCPTCGKELYDNGEDHFNCPFCGAEVVGERFAAEETAEEKFRRLERELARKKVETGVDGQNSAFARFGFARGGYQLSLFGTQAVRNALERSDMKLAGKHFAKAFKVGCLLYLAFIIVVVVVVVAVFVSRACNGNL